MSTRLQGGTRGLVLCAALAALAAAVPAGHAAAAAERSVEDRLADLEKRLGELEASLRRAIDQGATVDAAELRRQLDVVTKELERMKVGEAAGAGEPTSVHGLGPAASKVYGVPRGVSIGGYGEALYQDFDATRDDGARTGTASTADFLRGVLYFGYKFDDRIVFNSEIEYEHATTGAGDEDLGEVSVEFATLDFLLHPSANVRAGLVLLPVGFLNELHEPPIFLGARRPEVENRVIPSTWREVGAGVFGDAGPFSYRAYVVNGLDAEGFSAASGLRGGRQSGSRAEARDLAGVARLDYHGVPGLLLGGSYYAGDSGQGAEDAAGDVIDGRITLYELHGEYRYKGLQVRGLWASADVDEAGAISREILGLDTMDPDPNVASAAARASVGSRIRGWYAEAGYDVLAHLSERTRQSVTPYVRYERLDTQDQVPRDFVTTGAADLRLVTYGAAYKPIAQVVIKAEIQDFRRGDGAGTDQVNVAVGYLF